MIIFGGRGGGPLADLWILQNAKASPTWSGPIPTNSPQGRLGHTAVYSPERKQMTVFGGAFDASGISPTNKLLGLTNADSISGSQWNQLSGGSSPSERWGHAAVYDSTQDRMIVFGGSTQTNGTLANDVWVLDQATTSPLWRRITVTEGPSARCCMAAAYDPAGHRMIVFGGFGGFDVSGPIVLGDLWTLTFNEASPSTATWQKLNPLGGTPPSSRCCGVALWDNGKFLLFGGGQFENPSADDKIHALVLNPATFATAGGPGGGPAPRVFPTAIPAGRFLLFGGASATAPLNDLWRLD
jgi:hypothetical protein